MRPTVALIRGGISGLSAAHSLARYAAHIGITLREASSRQGGVMETTHRDGFLVEAVADNFLSNPPAAVDLCREIGKRYCVIILSPQHRRSFVVHLGCRMWPLMKSRILSWRGKVRAGLKYFAPPRGSDEEESVASVVCRRFGRELYERLVQPLVGCIYGGEPERISITATMPRFRQMERESSNLIRAALRQRREEAGSGARYSQFAALRDGMSSLVDALAEHLPRGTVQLASPVNHILPHERDRWMLVVGGDHRHWLEADALILATPAYRASKLFAGLDSTLAAKLAEIEYSSCAVVALGYRRDQITRPLDGFGFVVPAVERRSILSCSYSSGKYAGRASEDSVLLRVVLGGTAHRGLLSLPDDELVELARCEVSELLQIDGEPILSHLNRRRHSLPPYHVGHRQRIEETQSTPGALSNARLGWECVRRSWHPGLHSKWTSCGRSLPRTLEAARANLMCRSRFSGGFGMTTLLLNNHCFERAIAWAIALIVLGASTGCQRSAQPVERAAKPAAETASQAVDTADEPTDTTTSESLTSQPQLATESGAQLYARHCGACHGERGDGKGIAAAFLFPKPRDFRAGRFRLVSTNNNVPTREDLRAVLLRGMPGSSMPPWGHLSQQERDGLVEEIMRMRSEGTREFYINTLKEDEGLTDEELAAEDVQAEIEEYVKEFTTPGESTEVPEAGRPTADSLARGKDAYARFACVQCHGETGKGDGAAAMVDDEGMPTRPRDFTLGIFKGNHDPASLYRRIAYGMPGTPMPASTTMTPEQMMDLVNYIRSLSSEEQREAAIPKRTKIVVKRVEVIPESAEGDVWDQSEPVSLQTTPLWWRNDADAKLSVQMLHDGTAIAVRMTWTDASANEHGLRSESFEDAIAIELYRGPAEPFLGMGDAKSPVDVWFWDADRQSAPLAAADAEYPNTVVDVFPFSEAVVATAEMSRPGARMADQPDISLPARAVGNLITPTENDNSGGTSLHVAGPRTVTFRVTQSQIVRARGTWSDGKWTVAMTRALSPSSQDDGISLEPGGTASVAFAVWDGMHGDRNGQKSVTIWQDMHLEP